MELCNFAICCAVFIIFSVTFFQYINMQIIINLSLLSLVMPEKCILLVDKVAYKQIISKWSILTAKSFTEERILRGSLLVELTEAESRDSNQYFAPPLNYKKYSDDLVKFYCEPEQILQLNDQQFNLLLGVKLPFDRYKAMKILNWAEKLRVSFGVNVAIPTILNPVRGIILYVGPLPSYLAI